MGREGGGDRRAATGRKVDEPFPAYHPGITSDPPTCYFSGMSDPTASDPGIDAPPDGPADPGEPGTPVDDTTLGGYFRVHDRPPAFEGPDGHPYTVSVEVEKVPDLRAPYEGYLVFPRWARNGLGIVGHVTTSTLWRGRSADEVRWTAGETPLGTVQDHLHTALDEAGPKD